MSCSLTTIWSFKCITWDHIWYYDRLFITPMSWASRKTWINPIFNITGSGDGTPFDDSPIACSSEENFSALGRVNITWSLASEEASSQILVSIKDPSHHGLAMKPTVHKMKARTQHHGREEGHSLTVMPHHDHDDGHGLPVNPFVDFG